MADVTDPQGAPDAEVKPAKRRLRAAPETIRERNSRIETTLQQKQQAAETSAPTVFSAFGRGFTWPLRMIGKGLAWVGRLKFFRVVGHILVPKYFRGSVRELRLVTWPGRKQSWKLTYAVIIFSVLFGAIVAVVDFGLDKLFKEFIVK